MSTATEEVEVVAFTILVASVGIGYCYDTYPIFHKIERFCPHASANMIFGVIVGAIISLFQDLDRVFSFDSELFFTYILPPIIFSAGYSLPKDFFFHNFGTIMTFAFVGTTISAFFIGSLLYAWGGHDMDFTKSMMMGSLISAVDPVAVILVLRTLNMDAQLKIILFGESVLNDAAAIVINRVFVSIESDERSTEDALSLAVFEIAGIAIGSILIGVVCALIVARLHKISKLSIPTHPRATEMASFLLGAFLPYAIAESLSLSGIMAVLFAGIIADYYTAHHLTTEIEHASRYMVQTLSYLGESFIFIYLGMSFFPASNHTFKGGYITLTIVLCFAGRALSIFPLAFLLNLGRKHKVPFKHQIVFWYSGLRGPVAYALAVATPEDPLYPDADNIIVSTTLIVVAFTTLFLGGFAFPFIKYLDVPLMDSTKRKKTETYDISNHWFSKLDNRYLKPYFGPEKIRKEHAAPAILQQSSVLADEAAEVDFNDDNQRSSSVNVMDYDGNKENASSKNQVELIDSKVASNGDSGATNTGADADADAGDDNGNTEETDQ